MSKLAGARCYLSGAIDRCPNLGVEWREWISAELQNRYEIIPYNPMDKPIDVAGEHEFREDRKTWKDNEEYEKLANFVPIIKNVDRRMCSKADFGIFYLDMNIFACGTLRELFWMLDDNKPTLLVCKQGKKSVPDWLFSEVPLIMIREDWDDIFEYLDKINQGWDDGTGRWLIFDY